MIFSVSNDVIEWSLSFGVDSVTLTVNDLVREITISSPELPLTPFFSERQNVLNNHLARVSNISKQEGTIEMRDEVLSSVGAQNVDTSGYQACDLDDVDLCWETYQLDVDKYFRPGIDTPFSPSIFNNFELGSLAGSPILTDEEQDKENSPPLPRTPVSERLTEPSMLMRSRPFGKRNENVPN